jgi:hypothetical protein
MAISAYPTPTLIPNRYGNLAIDMAPYASTRIRFYTGASITIITTDAKFDPRTPTNSLADIHPNYFSKSRDGRPNCAGARSADGGTSI